MSGKVADGEIIVRRGAFLDDDIGRTLGNQQNVVVADLQVVHVEQAGDRLARRSVTLALSTLILTCWGSEH